MYLFSMSVLNLHRNLLHSISYLYDKNYLHIGLSEQANVTYFKEIINFSVWYVRNESIGKLKVI